MHLSTLIRTLVVAVIFTYSTAYAQADRLTISNGNGVYTLAVPVSNLTLIIPDSGLTVEPVNIGGSTSNPRYFNLFNKGRGLVISGWFESSSRFRSAKTTWETDTAEWKKKGQPEPVDVNFEHIEGWETVLYDLPINGFTNSHLRAHHVQDGTWIDTHLSITNKESSADNRKTLNGILKSLDVRSKAGGYSVQQHGLAQ